MIAGKSHTHHTMTLEVRVCVQNAVCRGVISCCVHGIRASFVKGCLKCLSDHAISTFQSGMIEHTGNRTSLVSTPVIVTILPSLLLMRILCCSWFGVNGILVRNTFCSCPAVFTIVQLESCSLKKKNITNEQDEEARRLTI